MPLDSDPRRLMAMVLDEGFVPSREPSRDEADRALVERASEGDEQAFGVIVRQYEQRVLGVARALVGTQADAEDVAQEAFVRAWRHLGQFRGRSAFRTWLLAIVANTARTYRARHRGRPDRTLDHDPADVLDRAPAAERLEPAILAEDEVRWALARLPDELREAVVLRDLEGLGYREIAELLAVPIGTVESRIFRGRAHLRRALGRRESGDDR